MAPDGSLAVYLAGQSLGLVRVAPMPLYNTYHEAWRFAAILREPIVAGHTA